MRILDTETTGLDDGTQLDEPVEIAITDEMGAVQFCSYLKPTVPITKEAAAVHDISEDQLTEAPTMADVLPSIIQAVDGHEVYVYNAKYDLRVINNACIAHGIIPPHFNYHCVMLDYSEAFGARSTFRDGQFRYWSLSAAYEQQFGKAPEGAHSALGDCITTSALLVLLQGQAIRDHTFPAFPVTFTQLAFTVGKNGKPYAVFYTAGGQKVNVFQDRWFTFIHDAGLPLQKMMTSQLDKYRAGTPLPIDPLQARIRYKGEWPEFVDLD